MKAKEISEHKSSNFPVSLMVVPNIAVTCIQQAQATLAHFDGGTSYWGNA